MSRKQRHIRTEARVIHEAEEDSKKLQFSMQMLTTVIRSCYCLHDEDARRIHTLLKANFFIRLKDFDPFMLELGKTIATLGIKLLSAVDDLNGTWWTFVEANPTKDLSNSGLADEAKCSGLLKNIIEVLVQKGRELTSEEIYEIGENSGRDQQDIKTDLTFLESRKWLIRSPDQHTWKHGPRLFFGHLEALGVDACELCSNFVILNGVKCPYERCAKLLHQRCMRRALVGLHPICPFCRQPLRINCSSGELERGD